MIRVPAIVERIDGNDAWVRLRARSGGCGRCDEPGGCGSAKLGNVFWNPTTLFRVSNRAAAQVGEIVILQLDEAGGFRGAMVGYGLAIVFLLAGAACGTFLASSGAEDLYALVGLIAGLAVSCGITGRLIRRWNVLGGLGVELVRGSECVGAQWGGRE